VQGPGTPSPIPGIGTTPVSTLPPYSIGYPPGPGKPGDYLTPPPMPSAQVGITPRPEYTDGVNVRSGPTVAIGDANIIGKLQGEAAPIGQFGREAAGIWWWKIRYNNENGTTTEGWVRSDVVNIKGAVSFPPPKPWTLPLIPVISVSWGFGGEHNGIDLISSSSHTVLAIADGVATAAPTSGNGYSVNVLHEHPDGKIYWTQYTHIAKANVRLGTFFEQSTQIGSYEQIGNSSGPHLHISIKNTNPTNPDDDYIFLHGQEPLDPALFIPLVGGA